mmetsp:Transcript_14586/g.44089  ORF Transcript_14586/g.44089 Transcript_14586/m.44089 type:complete len:270 (+) Transcript_14586:281-1090(+)
MSFAYAPVAGRGTQRGHPGRGCSGTCQEGRRRACLGRDLGEPVAAAVHVLLEAADLADAAIANLRPLVVVLDLHVQRRLLLAVCGGDAAGLLDQEAQGRHLEQDAQLGLGAGAGHVGEHTLLLNDDLEHVGHHAASVPQSVLLANPVADQLLVLGVVEGRPQVAGGKHFALADLSGLLHVQPLAVILQQKLVAARGVLERDDVAGAGAEHTHARRRLVPPGDTLQLVAGPHTEDGAHSEVGVHDGGAVQGVEGHGEALAAHVHWLRHLL